jgi:uncharacterized protein (TIGR03118 family)
MSFAVLTKLPRRLIASAFLTAAFVSLALVSGRLPGSSASESTPTRLQDAPRIVFGAPYRQTNLVSDLPGVGLVEDRRLVNPWGIAVGSILPFWVNNNKGDLATLYRGDVGGSPLAPNPNPSSVAILNTPTLVATPATPTAVVANTSNDFQVAIPPFGAQPAQFIVATQLGGINAWHSNFGIASPAVVVRFVSGHSYTGLAIASNASGNLLYAADFANGKIDVFDKNFGDTSVSGNFTDATVPANFHPYNIQNLNGSLYVTYAEFSHVHDNDFGFVRKFNSDGVRDPAFAINNGPLADPYGLAIAPADFGAFGNRLLVGNYRTLGLHAPSISAFHAATGALIGAVLDEGGSDAIEIKKLRGLTFGNGMNGGELNTLYFVSGFPNEQFQQPHGLLGSLKAVTGAPTTNIKFSAPDYFTSEAARRFDVTVTRSGDLSGVTTVNYATVDSYATQKSDYEIALGKLTFNPGEASKTFRVLIVDDNNIGAGTSYDLQLVLSNATGGALVAPNIARLFIMDNEGDTQGQPENIIDDAQFFVRQQYYDFLNREPDQAGLDFWTNQITSCGTDQACIELKRINVSAAFFLSIEFQKTGMLAYLTEKFSYGGLPRYGQFMRDTQALQKDYVFGAPGAAAQLEANKQAFFDEFVTRPEFVSKFGGLSNENFVQAFSLGTTGELYIAQLTSAQVVPSNSSTAKGLVVLRQPLVPDNTIAVSLYLNGLSSTETEAQIHGPADPGANGPLIISLPAGDLVDFKIPLSNQAFRDLSSGHVYIDVRTSNFPNGEIRAQFPSNLFKSDMIIRSLNAGIITRAQALRLIVEGQIGMPELNRAFVLMEYFGYLRRNPDDLPDVDLSGYNFWLNKLNQFNGNFVNADMVKAFLKSTEYRRRFSP